MQGQQSIFDLMDFRADSLLEHCVNVEQDSPYKNQLTLHSVGYQRCLSTNKRFPWKKKITRKQYYIAYATRPNRVPTHSLNNGCFFDSQKRRISPYLDTSFLKGKPKLESIEDGHCLGQGTFSVVIVARFKKQSILQVNPNPNFALKVVRKKVPYDYDRDEMTGVHKHTTGTPLSTIAQGKEMSNPEDIDMELYCLEKLDHPNLTSSIFAMQDRFQVYIGLERMTQNLLEFARYANQLMKKGVRNASVIYHILVIFFRGVFEGVNHMHAAGVLHLDLKPENIMVNRSTLTCKVSDFGLARFAPTCGKVGTDYYMAPEVAESESDSESASNVNQQTSNLYSYPADVYSLIMTVKKTFCVAFGVGDTDIKLKQIIGQRYYQNLNDLLIDGSSKYPQSRMTLEQLLEKPFFKKECSC